MVALLHLLGVFLVALPRAMVTPADLKKTEVRGWFEDRTAELSSLGFEVSTEELVAQAVWWGEGYESIRRAVTTPATRYANWTGARQSWRMFGDVPRRSAYFFIEARRGEIWEPLYVARSGEAAWRRDFFDQERPRTFLNQFTRRRNRAAWRRFTVWLDGELRHDFPDVVAFRAGWQEVRFPAPEVLSETRALEHGERFWVAALGPRDEP